MSRRRRPDVQAFGTIIVCREETHPDEIELLELVANGRLPFVRAAATHAGRCRLCARTVADLLRIAATMFESEPEEETSAASRRRAVEAATQRTAGTKPRGTVKRRA